MRIRRSAALSAAVAALSFVPGVASALDAGWVGLDPFSTSFTNPLNWQVFFVPGSGDRAVFSTVLSSSNPSFGSGTVTIDQLLISSRLLDQNNLPGDHWHFFGLASNENLKVNTDVTIVDIGSGAHLEVDGLDVFTPVTNITNNTQLTVTGSSTYDSDVVNLSGNGSFTIDSGNTLRGAVQHSSTATSFVSGLLDTTATLINNGGILGIAPSGHIFLNGGNHTISNGILGFSSGGTMSFNFGSVLNLQSSGLLDFQGSYAFEDGAILNVTSGGDVTGASFLDLGNGNTGTMTVDGAGSSIRAFNSSDWGTGTAGFATVTLSNSGAGTYENLRLGLSNGRATVSLLSGSQLTTTGAFTMGPSSGTSSLLNMTIASSTLTTGGAALFRNGAVVNLNPGGQINLNNDGTFAVGSTLNISGGNVNIASGRTFTLAGGAVNRTSGWNSLNNGATLRIIAGTFTTSSFFDVANGAASGTMIVDGAAARFNSTSGVTDWGQNTGNFATITFANGGVGTYSGGLQIADGGGTALVNISTGAQLNASALVVGGTGSTATINLSGGTLNSTSAANFNGGAVVNLSTGGLVLNGNTAFNTGATLNWTGGVLDIASAQTLALNGGQVQASVPTGLSNNATLRINANGLFNTSTFFDIAGSAGMTGTLVVDGANARIISNATPSNFSFWANGAGSVGTFNLVNGGAGTFAAGLDIADGGATAHVNIGTNSILNTASLLTGSTGATANINITGGTLNSMGVAQFLEGTAVNVTGTGVLKLGGNSTFSTGSSFNGTSTAANSGLQWADNTILEFNGGAGTIAAIGSGIPDNGTLRITNGGSFTAVENFNINGAGGTMLVSGPGSKFTAMNTTSPTNFMDNGAKTVEISNAGAATFTGTFAFARFGGTGTLNILSGGTLTVGFTSVGTSGTATINVNGGTLRGTSAFNLSGATTLNFASGTVNIGGTLGVGAFDAAGAKVLLTPGGNKVLRVGGLDIPAANGGQVDLADNDMIIDYTGASPYSTILGYLFTGRNGGLWNGPGLVASTAAGNTQVTLGIAEASDLGSPATFFGQPIDGTTLLTKYTYLGDANLDGQVDITDLARLATNWQVSGRWAHGDFDYSGFIDITDLAALATNWQLGVGAPLAMTFEQAMALVGLGGSSVPEPGAVLVAVAPLAALARRRRHSVAW